MVLALSDRTMGTHETENRGGSGARLRPRVPGSEWERAESARRPAWRGPLAGGPREMPGLSDTDLGIISAKLATEGLWAGPKAEGVCRKGAEVTREPQGPPAAPLCLGLCPETRLSSSGCRGSSLENVEWEPPQIKEGSQPGRRVDDGYGWATDKVCLTSIDQSFFIHPLLFPPLTAISYSLSHCMYWSSTGTKMLRNKPPQTFYSLECGGKKG